MKLDLKLESKTNSNAKKVLKKEQDKKFQPSWEEVWVTGYTRPTGTFKEGIFKTKLTATDKKRLEEVKRAIEEGVIGTQVDDLKKFTKTHALRLHKHLMEVTREQTIREMVENKPDNYHLIDNSFELLRLKSKMKHEKFIGLDTETTGLDVFGKDKVVGISISLPSVDQHFYIPFRHNVRDRQLPPEEVFRELKPLLEDERLGKVLHNAKFDVHMFRKEGIKVKGIIMDIMVSMHILNENEPSYALKNLATKWGKYFGFEDKSATYEELFGKGGFENTPLDIGTVYACKDTHLVVQMYYWIMSHLEKQPKLMDIHKLETDILKVVIEMEANGFEVDLEFAQQYKKELEAQVKELEEQLIHHFGDINLNSPDQLKNKLFNELGLPDRNKGSVDAKTLKGLRNEHEGIAVLLEYRELNKLLTTYFEPLPKMVSPIDNRLHGQFKQSGTVTGRFSSSDPNLQNLPYQARKIFIAPEGKILVGMDFSKVEPTILACMSMDEHFLQPFIDDVDIYSALASRTFHKPIEACGDGTTERNMMKTGLLATMYGTSMFTLSEQLGISIEEAEEFIERFLTQYDVVAKWIDSVHELVDRQGFVETMFGRKRRFIGHIEVAKRFHKVESQVIKILGRKPKNIWDEDIPYKLKQQYWNIAGKYFRASRQSVNAIIQGTGADIMKKALVNVYNLFQEWGTEYKLIATIHDEILMEVPEDITLEQIEQIEDVMKNCVSMYLPLKQDTELMHRWGEGVSKKEYFKGGFINEKI